MPVMVSGADLGPRESGPLSEACHCVHIVIRLLLQVPGPFRSGGSNPTKAEPATCACPLLAALGSPRGAAT